MLLHRPFFPSPSSNQLQAGRVSVCLGMPVASQVHDSFTGVLGPSGISLSPQKRCGFSASPTPAPDLIPPGSKAGGAPRRHRGVRLSCVSVGMWHLISFPPSHHPGGTKSFMDSQVLSQALSRTLKFHSCISSQEKPWSLHCTRAGSSGL